MSTVQSIFFCRYIATQSLVEDFVQLLIFVDIKLYSNSNVNEAWRSELTTRRKIS